jgi:ABC-2 type transport system permease protein
MLPLLVILLAMGAVNNEKRRRTLPIVVTRPVSRRALIRAKLLAAAALLASAQLLSAGLCLLYTRFLFGEVALGSFAALNGLFLLLLLCFLSVTLLASTLLSSPAAAAGVGVAFFALVALLGMLEKLAAFSPAGLQNAITDLVLGREPAALMTPIIATLVISALSVLAAEQALVRQEL